MSAFIELVAVVKGHSPWEKPLGVYREGVVGKGYWIMGPQNVVMLITIMVHIICPLSKNTFSISGAYKISLKKFKNKNESKKEEWILYFDVTALLSVLQCCWETEMSSALYGISI